MDRVNLSNQKCKKLVGKVPTALRNTDPEKEHV